MTESSLDIAITSEPIIIYQNNFDSVFKLLANYLVVGLFQFQHILYFWFLISHFVLSAFVPVPDLKLNNN